MEPTQGTAKLERLWARTRWTDRLLFLVRASDMTAENFDLSRMFGVRGFRPRAPAASTPDVLVRLIRDHGMSLTGVGQRIGVGRRTVVNWWSGVTRPRPENVVALLKLARIEVQHEDIDAGAQLVAIASPCRPARTATGGIMPVAADEGARC